MIKQTDRKTQAKKLIQTFVKKHNLTKDFILKNELILNTFINNFQLCQLNPNLKLCKQITTGYKQILKLYSNDRLIISNVQCEHRRALNKKHQVENGFVFYDFDKTKLKLDIQNKNDVFHDKQRMPILRYFNKINLKNIRQKNQKGLYLSGVSGKGKTWIFIACANYFAKRNIDWNLNLKIVFISCDNLLLKLRQNINLKEKKDFLKILDESDILFLDDFSGYKWTEWVRDDVFFHIFNHRNLHEKLTFINSNFDLQITQNILNKIKSNELINVTKDKNIRLIQRIKRLTNSLVLN